MDETRRKAERLAKELKGKFWSVYDKQLGKVTHTGRNSGSRKQAVNEIFEWWLEGAELTEEDCKRMTLEWSVDEKGEMIRNVGFKIFPHEDKIDED